jgi:hypothetical protein
MDTDVITSNEVIRQGEFEVRSQGLESSWHLKLVQRIPFHHKETAEATEPNCCKAVAHH